MNSLQWFSCFTPSCFTGALKFLRVDVSKCEKLHMSKKQICYERIGLRTRIENDFENKNKTKIAYSLEKLLFLGDPKPIEGIYAHEVRWLGGFLGRVTVRQTVPAEGHFGQFGVF